jgi:DNA polymerase-3 subunit epsilon
MGRCLSPCLGDLDPNLYRRRLDEALGLFTGDGDGGAALLRHLEAQMREAAAAEAFERAAWLKRRHGRLRVLLGRLGPVLRAVHTHPRLVLAGASRAAGPVDAFWLVGGRVVDMELGAPAPPAPDALAERTAAALRARTDPHVGPDELDELRIVSTWLAGHRPAVLELAPRPGPARLERFLRDSTDVLSRGEAASLQNR